MGVLTDLLFSVVFGGALLVISLNARNNAADTQWTHGSDMRVQETLITTVQLLEGELRNMGFGVPEHKASVIAADSTSLAFLCDLARCGSMVDTIKYSLGSTGELSGTRNELDRYLRRRVNGGVTRHVGVVTQFHLAYFTRAGERLSTPVPDDRLPEIHVVEVTIEVQNQDGLVRDNNQVLSEQRTAIYSSSLWQQTRLTSQNTRR